MDGVCGYTQHNVITIDLHETHSTCIWEHQKDTHRVCVRCILSARFEITLTHNIIIMHTVVSMPFDSRCGECTRARAPFCVIFDASSLAIGFGLLFFSARPPDRLQSTNRSRTKPSGQFSIVAVFFVVVDWNGRIHNLCWLISLRIVYKPFCPFRWWWTLKWSPRSFRFFSGFCFKTFFNQLQSILNGREIYTYMDNYAHVLCHFNQTKFGVYGTDHGLVWTAFIIEEILFSELVFFSLVFLFWVRNREIATRKFRQEFITSLKLLRSLKLIDSCGEH